jgi:hypothetical protein
MGSLPESCDVHDPIKIKLKTVPLSSLWDFNRIQHFINDFVDGDIFRFCFIS